MSVCAKRWLATAMLLMSVCGFSVSALGEEIRVADSQDLLAVATGVKSSLVDGAQPRLRQHAAAIYPARAMIRGITGYVVIGYDVNAAGRTENIRVLEGTPGPMFYESAMTAVANSLFEPSETKYTNLKRTLTYTITP
ncbi:energy transducer TonB [Aestuariicella hydrocarbonica]|uniref:Protein TonB n=1 Tax=Pseudomaricurvus hydrocarbonicus TaxID=1470433 RepID=A0A9E5MNR9_9GAMM|nr:energy transducer TonB [Aestuariicella hydrocarbonica]NHO67582.1 energy transducer TonB [Aestuariicella hydrocarbonica]